jgi:hypothetical protein
MRLQNFTVVLLMSVSGALPATAGSIQYFDAINSGAYDEVGQRKGPEGRPPAEFYMTGAVNDGTPSGIIYRGFLLFDLANLSIPVGETVAKVALILDTQHYVSPDDTEFVRFFEVTTPADELLTANPFFEGVEVFNDLGDGTTFGGHLYDRADNLQTLSLPLALTAESAVENARGTTFAIGLRLMTLRSIFAGTETLYTRTAPDGPTPRLEVVVAVPEPSSCTWFVAVMGAMGAKRRQWQRNLCANQR